jgi:hypothetical protein
MLRRHKTPPTLTLVLFVPAARHADERYHCLGRTTKPLSRLYNVQTGDLSQSYGRALCQMVTRILSEHGAGARPALTRSEATKLCNHLLRTTTLAQPLGPLHLRSPNKMNLDDRQKLSAYLFAWFSMSLFCSDKITLHVDIGDELLCRYCGEHSPGYGRIVKDLKNQLTQRAFSSSKNTPKPELVSTTKRLPAPAAAVWPRWLGAPVESHLENVESPVLATTTIPSVATTVAPLDAPTMTLPAPLPPPPSRARKVHGLGRVLWELVTIMLRHILTCCLAFLTPDHGAGPPQPAMSAIASGPAAAMEASEPLATTRTGDAFVAPNLSTIRLDPSDTPTAANQWRSDNAECTVLLPDTKLGLAEAVVGMIPTGDAPLSPTKLLPPKDPISTRHVKSSRPATKLNETTSDTESSTLQPTTVS